MSKRIRKSVMLDWEKKFFPKLHKIHKNHWKNVFHRLMKKTSTLKSTLKRRSREYEVECDITLRQIRDDLLAAYGKQCKYCTNKLRVNNIVCDHIVPLSLGGGSIPTNLQMICNRCNTRKGPLTDNEYVLLIKWLAKQNKIVGEYVLRKLARADVMGL